MKDDNVLSLKHYTINREEKPSFTDSIPGLETKEQPSSHLIRRSIAFIVDIFSIMLLKMTATTSYALFVNDFMLPFSSNQKLVLINGSFAMSAFLFVSIYYSYFLFTHYILNGRSIGKLAMNLRTIDENFVVDKSHLNYNLSFKMVARRSLGYLVCYLSFGTFFIFNFTSEDKRGFADFISGSRTVDEKWRKARLAFKEHCSEEVTIDIYSLDQVA